MNGSQDGASGLTITRRTTKGTMFVIFADNGYIKTKSPLTTYREEVALRRLLLTRMRTLSPRTDCVTIKRDQAPSRR